MGNIMTIMGNIMTIIGSMMTIMGNIMTTLGSIMPILGNIMMIMGNIAARLIDQLYDISDAKVWKSILFPSMVQAACGFISLIFNAVVLGWLLGMPV